MAGSPSSSAGRRRPAAAPARSRSPAAKAVAKPKSSPKAKAKASPSSPQSPFVLARRAKAKARAQRLYDDLNQGLPGPYMEGVDDQSDHDQSLKERRIERLSKIYSDFVQHRDHDYSYGEDFERWATWRNREMVRYGWYWDPTRENWFKLVNQ